MARRECERGASATEYALVASGVAALLALMMWAFGDNVRDPFDETCRSVAQAAACVSD